MPSVYVGDDRAKSFFSAAEFATDDGKHAPQGLKSPPENRNSGYALSKNISRKGPRNCRSLGSPGFPVESCGFGQLHVVLFKENHISGAVESCDVGNPGSLGMTKRRGLLKGKGQLLGIRQLLGEGTPFPSTTAVSIDTNRFCARAKKSQALRMTTLVAYAENTKRSKKSRGSVARDLQFRRPFLDMFFRPSSSYTPDWMNCR